MDSGTFNDITKHGKSSKFNAGMMQMYRIHTSQAEINSAFVNPTAFNLARGVYNYEVIIRETCNLYLECFDKLSKAEREYIEKFRLFLDEYLVKLPIHTKEKDGSTKFRPERWNKLREPLFRFHREVKLVLAEHDINSPAKEDDDGL